MADPVTPLHLGITADLHWGINRSGDAATRAMLDFLKAQPVDLLVLAGDIGTEDHFAECLARFAVLPCRKALVPGNHDIWVKPGDSRGDSLDLYQTLLPDLSRRHGFQYLDQGPLLLPDSDLALAGTINWYDYSWSIDELKRQTPDWEHRLAAKVFSRGRHNDANYVRWATSDDAFTARVVAAFRGQLGQALAQVRQVIVITHHPCARGLNYPRPGPPTLDGLLWEAFSGNRRMEETLFEFQERIPFAFSGHTHRARENLLGGVRGYNIGGDYDHKRLLLLDWPAGTITPHEFRA